MRTGVRRIGVLAALLVACVVVFVFGSAPAHAAGEKEKEAAEHFKAGKKAFDALDYDKAVAEYLAAYELSPRPVLLYNVGCAYQLKGEKRKAVVYFQRYL